MVKGFRSKIKIVIFYPHVVPNQHDFLKIHYFVCSTEERKTYRIETT